MNDATRAMIVTSMDSLSQVIIALHLRIDKLEEDNTAFANQLSVLRMDHIDTLVREKVEAVLENSDVIGGLLNERIANSEKIDSKIEDALENYDPTGAMQFDDRVNELINDYSDDDVADKIRSFIENKVSVEMNVSRY